MDMQRSYYYSPHLYIVLIFSWIKDFLKDFGQRSPNVGFEGSGSAWSWVDWGSLQRKGAAKHPWAGLRAAWQSSRPRPNTTWRQTCPFLVNAGRTKCQRRGKLLGKAQLSEWVSWSCCNQQLQPGQLKQHRHILSHFWRLEVLNRDVSRAMLSLEVLGENPSCLF